MIVWRGLETVPAGVGPYAVTIGTFDGVHRGHQAVIAEAAAVADRLGAATCVMTLHPHPMTVVRPDAAPLALATLDRRLELIAATGADAAMVAEFTADVSHLTPEEFVQRYVVDALAACAVIVGEGFRFGHRAAGDVALLRRLGDELGFEVVEVRPAGDGTAYSSTRARELITVGDVHEAWHVLGRPHLVEGPVVEGERRGRELGFPTANLALPAGIAVPADGVYAGWLTHTDGTRLPAAISVGTNPTFGEHARRVEAYVLDRDDLDLYDEHVVVEFGWWLRGMVTFDSVDALLAQMAVDVERARALAG